MSDNSNINGKVRSFELSDVNNVKKLLSFLETLYPNGLEWLDDRLKKTIAGESDCFVLEVDNQIFGVIMGTPKPAKYKITTFFVSEDFRGQGFASQLLDRVLSKAFCFSAGQVYLTCPHTSLKYFESFLLGKGFQIISVQANRYGVDRHEVVLQKDLSIT